MTYILTYIHEVLLLQNPFLVPDVDHGPQGLRRVLCMQAAGSVDYPLPPQSDAGGWGRATCGRDWVTGGEGQGHRWVGWNTNGWSNVTVDG